MASLKELVYELMGARGETDNHILYNRIKRLLIENRATAIRRDIARNGVSDEYVQYCPIELIKVNAADIPNGNDTAKVLRSKNRIPSPVRIQNNTPFLYVGTKDLSIPFVYVSSYATAIRMRNTDYFKHITLYAYTNKYIYVYSNDNNIKEISVGSPFINPHLIDDSNSTYTKEYVDDEDEFLLPEDMLLEIKSIILKTDLAIKIEDDGAVKIDKDNEVGQ